MFYITFEETEARVAKPSAVQDDAHVTRSRLLSELYPPPYEAFGGLRWRHFADRLGDSLARCLEDLAPAVTSTIHIYLTPALDAGGAAILSSAENMHQVIVELSPRQWKEAGPRARRDILLDCAVEGFRLLGESRGFGDEVIELAREQTGRAYEDLVHADGQLRRSAPIDLDNEVLHDLSLPGWRNLGEARKRQIGRLLAGRLSERGQEIISTGVVETPGGVVARFVDRHSELVFHLVPGGAFAPGFSEPMLERASDWFEFFDRPGDPVVRLYGSDVACDLRLGERVELDPLLMAAGCLPDPHSEPHRQGLPWLEPWKKASWTDAADLCIEQGWSLPSDLEFEWAVRAGAPKLYPWGNDTTPIIADLIGDAQTLAQNYGKKFDVEGRRPEATEPLEIFKAPAGFGLTSPLSRATWCLPDLNDEATPLVACGGGLDTYPWQSGHESAAFFTAARMRWGIDLPFDNAGACIRPVIRLR